MCVLNKPTVDLIAAPETAPRVMRVPSLVDSQINVLTPPVQREATRVNQTHSALQICALTGWEQDIDVSALQT